MILADTSVWVEHLRQREPSLVRLLQEARVACHPFVIGEIALGHVRQREAVLSLLAELPALPQVSHKEVLQFVAVRGLAGAGIGWIDAHLLAGAALGGARLWTLDRRLATAARRLGLAWEE